MVFGLGVFLGFWLGFVVAILMAAAKTADQTQASEAKLPRVETSRMKF
jgi:hypothetical protein